jgi:hypothetical protein
LAPAVFVIAGRSGPDQLLHAASLAGRCLHYLVRAAVGVFGVVPDVVLPRYDFTFSQANFVSTPSGFRRVIGPVRQLRLTFMG